MEFIKSIVFLFWANLISSLAFQVFVFSTVVLLVGISILVWSRAVKLSPLEPISLKEIERSQPHIPSLRAIITIFICFIALLVVAMNAIRGVPPLDGPYEFLYLAAFFVLCAAGGVLSELYYEGSKEYFFASIIGTALAYIFLVLKYTIPLNKPMLSIILLMILIGCAILAKWESTKFWKVKVCALSLIIFIFWVVLYLWV
ncbi:hypothetical protein KKF55_01735 [Patescibacteria group bacterium]|nr:hypothetical protein [Patescibacteria group bacterium]